jgi:hypothetical protein
MSNKKQEFEASVRGAVENIQSGGWEVIEVPPVSAQPNRVIV